jgi:hypothetical protein
MEDLWVRRELGEELSKYIATKGYDLVFVRSNSQTMPEDIYCRCDIYIDIKMINKQHYLHLNITKHYH